MSKPQPSPRSPTPAEAQAARADVLDPLALERARTAEAAAQIRFSERVPIPTPRGKPQMFKQHVTAGARPNDYSIPYDPASLRDSVWRGFALCEDRHGSRYVPVQLTWAQLQAVWRDELVGWDTRASQAERIEREFTADAFTLRTGCWAERSLREQFSVWAKRRGDGDKPPGHYMSHVVRRLERGTVREVFAELAAAGFLGSATPGDAEAMTAKLLASLTVV